MRREMTVWMERIVIQQQDPQMGKRIEDCYEHSPIHNLIPT